MHDVLPFTRIGIVGVGLIGGSLGLALKRADPTVRILGVGRDRGRLETAVSLGAVDSVATNDAALAGCDLVVLATPVDHILERLGDVARAVRRGAVLTDVGSTKRLICARAAEVVPPTARFVGGHPIAGREMSGVDNSLVDLFQGTAWILCPAGSEEDTVLESLEKVVTAVGARPVVMSADEHDRVLARLSHLPQILSTALAFLVAQDPLEVSGTGLRSMLRLSGSPHAVWQPVLKTNGDEIGAALDEYVGLLEEMRGRLRERDLKSYFDRAIAAYQKVR